MKQMKWNVKNIYNDVKDFEKDITKIHKLIKQYSNIKLDVSTIQKVHNILKLEKRIDTTLYKIFTYISLKKEMQNSEMLRYREKEVDNLYASFLIDILDFEHAIYSLSKSRQQRILNSPQMKLYKRRFDIVINRKRKSSKKEEKFLTHLDPITENIPSIYSQILDNISFNEIQISQNVYKKVNNSNIKKLLLDPNRVIRKKAWNEKVRAFEKTVNSFTDILDINIKDKALKAKVAKYTGPIEYVLDQEEIKERHVNKVLNTIVKNQPITEKFLKLKASLMGTNKIYSYDERFDVFNYRIPVNKALNLVNESLFYFRNDSKTLFKRLMKQNHFYITNKTDKFIPYSGYCFTYGVTDPYMFIYYQNNLDSAMTIAHEFGHVVHQHKLNNYNSFWDRDNSLIVHETASYTHEIILLLHMLHESPNKATKKKILFKLIQYYYDVFVNKGITTKLERYVYKQVQNNKPLRIDNISSKYQDFCKEFKGNTFAVTKTTSKEWIGNERLNWSFYELKYIIALALANKIAFDIFDNNTDTINKFNKMMKMGDEYTVPTILNLFGCSYNKINELINEGFQTMNDLIDEFNEL